MSQAIARRMAAATRIPRSGQVLDLVRRGQARTTGDLARALGLARSTVNDRIDVLLESGLLIIDEAPSGRTRGRPAMTLRFNPGVGVALAAQVDAMAVRVAVTDLAGGVHWSERCEVDPSHGMAGIARQLSAEFDRGLSALGVSSEQVHGIGVSVPGTESMPEGAVVQLQEGLQGWSPTLIHVDRDVNLVAFGEHCVQRDSERYRESDGGHSANGGDRDASCPETLLALQVGTAIGCGVVVAGRVVRGAAGTAGAIGHTPVAGATAACGCGRLGCLDAVASGGALARDLREAGRDTPDAPAVARLALGGDVVAGQAIYGAGLALGDTLAGVINLLNPSLIAVSGCLADAGDQLIAGLQEGVARSAHAAPAAAVRIQLATLRADAVIHGAAMTVVEHALRPESLDAHLSMRHSRG